MAEIFRRAGPAWRRGRDRPDRGRLKVMAAIEACRTAVLGGHLYQCEGCGREHPRYNSCRNRHCPACQGAAARRWMEARARDILPVPTFHVVFTLPNEIADIAFANRRTVLDILFRTAAETLRTIAADPRRGGVRIGGTAVLHTWNQRLLWHPHLHCVVPNGGFDVDTGDWKTGSGRFLAPVKVLASLFRRRFLEELASAHDRGEIVFRSDGGDPDAFGKVLARARARDWVVFAKRPFRGPRQVFAYLSRYTHRVAIGDSRILGFDGETVRFRCRRPKLPGQRKPRYGVETVTTDTFITRFMTHVLPDGFHRIRHFGILANGCRRETLDAARAALGVTEPEPEPHDPADSGASDEARDEEDAAEPLACPHCGAPLRHLREIPTGRPGRPGPGPGRDPPPKASPMASSP
ncbi:MAG: IS91 family transposase [Boseongicola sp.]|nr:IS91 family transposase [Boseongicola sp.]